MRKKGLAWIAAIAVAGTAAYFLAQGWRARNKPHIAYRKIAVIRGDIQTTILATGTVAPENRLDLKPPVAGRIEQVLVQEGQTVHGGQVLAYLSSTERATLIDTAKSQGKEEVAYWQDAYKMTPILAPKRGLIILKNADSGQTVTQSDIVLSMSDRLIVKANVDETDLAQIKNKQEVRIVLDAFPGNPLPASVEHIGYDAKTINNVTTYEVDVLAANPPEFMKSGMTANATFLVAERSNVLLVPAAAVHRKDKRSFVLAPDPASKGDAKSELGGEPVEKEVEVGLSDGKRVEIVSGAKEGDPLLIASLSSFAREEKSNNPFSSMSGGAHGPPPPRH
jgi:macrolide-specific efflux system membrane fusion protein